MKTVLKMTTFVVTALCLGLSSGIAQIQPRGNAPTAAIPAGTRVAVIDINFIFKNHPRFKQTMDGIKNDIGEEVGEIFKTSFVSKRTDIFSSLILAQKVFHKRQTRKVLILMSDMIVDYPPYRFDKMNWGEGKQEALLSELEEKGLIADLSGVCVYVSGASGSSDEQAAMIGRFWQAYFERSGANMN